MKRLGHAAVLLLPIFTRASNPPFLFGSFCSLHARDHSSKVVGNSSSLPIIGSPPSMDGCPKRIYLMKKGGGPSLRMLVHFHLLSCTKVSDRKKHKSIVFWRVAEGNVYLHRSYFIFLFTVCFFVQEELIGGGAEEWRGGSFGFFRLHFVNEVLHDTFEGMDSVESVHK